MAQTAEPIPNSLGLHTIVTDAISEWQELYDSHVEAYNNKCRVRDPEAPALPQPNQDYMRARFLRELIRDYFVSFEDWCAEEVLAFAFFACPLQNLKTATTAGKDLEFLAVLHSNWKPRFLSWAYFLWEFTERACELFADVLFLMPHEQRPDASVVGTVLFKDMIELDLVPPAACASFVGALLPHPYESTYARKHEETIELYSKLLRPKDIGLVCRSLVLYRSRDPEKCNCGYKRGEVECVCAKKEGEQNSNEVPRDPLAYDLEKEYAAIIMKLILDRNGIQVLEDELRWTPEDRDEFVRSACEEVFSEAVYTEIYQNLNKGEFPRLKQVSPRKITEIERRTNVTRSFDNDYNFSMAAHGGCVSRGCKQAMKTDCANVSCKRHCTKNGCLQCKAHRHYTVILLPTEPGRKNILRRDERQARFTQEREGEDI